MKNKELLVILFISILALIISSCAGGAKTILVTAITVTGEDNQEEVLTDETLQMIAQIQPENASNKGVTWSV